MDKPEKSAVAIEHEETIRNMGRGYLLAQSRMTEGEFTEFLRLTETDRETAEMLMRIARKADAASEP